MFISARTFSAFLFSAGLLIAAPPSRVTRPVDPSRATAVAGHVHRLAQPQFDRGAVEPGKRLNTMILLVKPSSAQQADLENLLFDQQNPSSKSFRKWLTPEQFGGRFGLNPSDQSKVVAWLTSAGFTVDHRARSANWIAFSGTAEQVTNALHTPIHQFQVEGRTHFANTQVPSVPEALSEVVAGFLGLNDFHPTPNAIQTKPDYTLGSTHYLAPIDFYTIYDLSPLYAAGIDGTGQSVAVVGQSDVLLSDIAKFRSAYGLSANVPKMLLYGADPGYNGAQFEGNLDIEWAGAVAPKATIYYVYGEDAFTAIIEAVELNVAPVVSASYSICEVDADPSFRAIAQQGNAQGITILTASGDAGAAACDSQASEPFATRGLAVNFPAVLPEVTGVGGTQFLEGSGTYWNTANAATTNGSALSYIPEWTWNESSNTGLGSSGGGVSAIYSKPLWQSGPGVPADGARDVPDVALSSALHDGYLVVYGGSTYVAGGTSCATPSMAAIVGLINHYQVANKIQTTAGVGNINPQLYRLAQKAPNAFHDIVSGNNVVQCAQGSPNCLTGSFGYTAGAAYDMTTGLGSVDANNLITQWNQSTNGTTVSLTLSASKGTMNDTIQVTATVTPASGSGTPTGTIHFAADTIALGGGTLSGSSVTVSVPLYEIGFTGFTPISAEYSGDASFSPSGATKTIQITTPATGATSIVPSAPTIVYPQPADAQGLSWQTGISLSEVAGVPALLTGLTIDGVAQTLSQYFPAPEIEPKSTVKPNFVFRGLAAPVVKTFVFTGTDPTGAVWSRQVAINFAALPTYDYYNLNATPLTAVQNPANTTCPWSIQLNLDDLGGYGANQITDLQAGSIDYAGSIASIFGTTRLDAFGSLQGTMCFSNVTTPAIDSIYLQMDSESYDILTVSFAAQPANPGTLSTTPATLSMAASSQPATATLTVNLSDQTQSWSASVYPANRTSSWLSASQLSGNGSGTITLTANGAGFEPGVYRATIVLQSQNSVPQYVNVPIMFVLGGSATGTAITGVANSASFKTSVSPGMLLSVFGSKLSNSTATNSASPLPYSLAGVSATVNGLAAPMVYASPGMLNIQVPFAAGAGPAVLGVNNNGQIAGFQFQMSPSSPGIFADANGNVVPTPAVNAGSALAFYVTGIGDVTPPLATAFSPSSGSTLATDPKPLLPLSVTVGGVPAFLEFAGITPGLIGVMQVNILVPSAAPLGNQPLVVTVGGVSSAPVNVVIQP